MSIILDGRLARAELKKTLIKKIKKIENISTVPPTLAIVQVGDRPDSTAFIAAKRKFAAEIGVCEKYVKIADTSVGAAGNPAVTQKKVIRAVTALDADPSVHGIIVQLPMPLAVDRDAVFAAMTPSKDVDGLSAANIEKWLAGRADAIWPATARGIRELLTFYKIPLAGKHVVVVGRSSLVGKPVAAMCLAEDATVTVCHSWTANLAAKTRRADILIVAIGSPHFIGASYVRKGQIVIDVGISKVEKIEALAGENKPILTGDVDFDAVKNIVAAITPVPGGVGQMTVLALFENLIDACYN